MSTNSEGMAAVVQALRDAHRQAVAAVDTIGGRIAGVFDINQVRRASLNRLQADMARIDDLAGRLRADVLNGVLAPEKWEEIAKLTFDDMNDAVRTNAEWPVGKIFWETVTATAQDVQEGARAAVVGGTPWLLLGIGAVLALKFLPSRK